MYFSVANRSDVRMPSSQQVAVAAELKQSKFVKKFPTKTRNKVLCKKTGSLIEIRLNFRDDSGHKYAFISFTEREIYLLCQLARGRRKDESLLKAIEEQFPLSKLQEALGKAPIATPVDTDA